MAMSEFYVIGILFFKYKILDMYIIFEETISWWHYGYLEIFVTYGES